MRASRLVLLSTIHLSLLFATHKLAMTLLSSVLLSLYAASSRFQNFFTILVSPLYTFLPSTSSLDIIVYADYHTTRSFCLLLQYFPLEYTIFRHSFQPLCLFSATRYLKNTQGIMRDEDLVRFQNILLSVPRREPKIILQRAEYIFPALKNSLVSVFVFVHPERKL